MNKNWVLMRGLARHSKHWGIFKELIQKSFPSDSFEFMDARGNGELNNEKSFLTIAETVDDLRLRSKAIARGEKINLVSISMGGMMAVDWVMRFSDEVDSVVCINTSDGGSSHFWDRLRPESYSTLFKILANNNDPVERERLSLELICNICKSVDEVAAEFSKLKVTTRENFLRQIVSASKFKFPKEKPMKPILLLAAENDRLVSVTCTKNIARMWNMKAEIHSQAGHDIPLDDPQWLIEKIKAFQN